ncbi:MAG: type II toxin-antitoxin system VapC family toxin [Deltaproteobacteria bacterium]|nr:type II toxin-antitoxin system VapC family toxin [Deltaproteobacteria bacterium]
MRLLDANLLIYAYNRSSPFHEESKRWLESLLSSPEPVCIPWPTLLAFVRITTDRRILDQPFTIAEAVEIVDEWLELPMVTSPQPSLRHWAILREQLTVGQATGPLVPDAHLAALAIEHGATLCSTDRDFSRFEGLRWENPLAQVGVVNEG